MSTPNGYNNPAFCHKYDSSLFEYQYVPEIDPDSPPDLNKNNKKQITVVYPSSKREHSESDEFEGSDESNGSIIVEECNNRRVTLICEKRNKQEMDDDNFISRQAYYQDVSLESENGCDYEENKTYLKKKNEERSFRHQRPLEPPKLQSPSITNFKRRDYPEKENNSGRQLKQLSPDRDNYHRNHRYEEILDDNEYNHSTKVISPLVHRYAEISTDENGYPSLKSEIEIQKERYFTGQYVRPKTVSKPRAISPVNYTKSYSSPPTPSRMYQKVPQSKELELSPSRFSPDSSSRILYSTTPVRTNSFEMLELSPPRSYNIPQQINSQTYFIDNPKRQPPIGASSINEAFERYPLNGKCIIPSHLQKVSKEKCHSAPQSPWRKKESQNITSPIKTISDKTPLQKFHIRPIKSSQGKTKSISVLSDSENNSARRNISHYFNESQMQLLALKKDALASPRIVTKSPYKPTTTEITQPKTAVITPIFQRKNRQAQDENQLSPKRKFEKLSQSFQSTGNLYKSSKNESIFNVTTNTSQAKVTSPVRIKRNQSVPNFKETFYDDNNFIARKTFEGIQKEDQKYSRNLDLQYSPKKQIENMSPIDKSRLSLIDHTRSSWSNLDSYYRPQCSTCFIFATIVQLITATATCAISFYLLSKVGRKYYLDFGILAGFVNFILGLLGFRSYCWRWLPNRNYVSGFIGLVAFSAFTCAGLSYIIIVKPMAGDPIMDIMGGAICAVSVLTIVLALTGLTMSGCCKTPPPDNRVDDLL